MHPLGNAIRRGCIHDYLNMIARAFGFFKENIKGNIIKK